MGRRTVVHAFYFYLPGTMNWAFQLMDDPERQQVRVAAPLMVRNQFWVPQVEPLLPPWHGKPARDEWSVPRWQRLWNRLLRPVYWWWLEAQLKQTRPDVLHAHFAVTGCALLPLARRLRLPLVVSFYGYDYEQLPRQQPRYRGLYRQLFQQAAAILCEGPHGRNTLIGMGASPEKVQVLRLGRVIPPQLTQPLPKPARQLHLVQAASMLEKKGHRYTLMAFAAARQQIGAGELTLTLVGEPADSQVVAEIRQLIADLHLGDAVTLLDFVATEQFSDFLRQFHAFIHPSTYAADGDCEGGAPVVLLDAQLAGLPVIATTHCDIPDVVVHGRSGWLCAERDVDALAAAILHFYRADASEFSEWQQAAQAQVVQGFDIAQTRQALAGVYERVGLLAHLH
jgi:colanic acid/amylovoran biosynthesis glycosyltransferase